MRAVLFHFIDGHTFFDVVPARSEIRRAIFGGPGGVMRLKTKIRIHAAFGEREDFGGHLFGGFQVASLLITQPDSPKRDKML